MATKLFNPFLDFRFDNKSCFLSGSALQSADEQVQVFPLWMMRSFDLEDKPFKMLDESMVTYKSLKLPCSTVVAEQIERIEKQVEEAMAIGYAAVKELPELVLFQWVAKILYGVVFNEIQAGKRQAVLSGEEMNFSQALVHKFRNLHAMLQSLVVPMTFDVKNPFSILVLPVDINTLIFSVRMNNFAIIATMQDNGTHAIYHEEELASVEGHVLHPIQFEEICARYFYSAYLFNRLPEYTYMETPAQLFVEPMPLNGQVLENFWKPWGYLLFEIIQNPDLPMTFLTDEEQQFKEITDLPK